MKVKVIGTVEKVQNMTQGGYRAYVDIPSIQREQAAHLMILADTPDTVFDITFESQKADEEADPWKE